MPQKEVRELIRELSPPPEPTAKEQEEADERKRERWLKTFDTLPDKQKFVAARAIYDYLMERGWKP